MTVSGALESVVLLDEWRRPVGTMRKDVVHSTRTPLHLAFSCYLFDDHARLLVTRRALSKATWPGVWTNTVCGHPGPGEEPAAAVVRRAHTELGLELDPQRLRLVLPDFAYRAVDAGGVVENEVCPVFVGHLSVDPDPSPAEVAQWRWVDWPAFAVAATAAPWLVSPWAAGQVPQLRAAGI